MGSDFVGGGETVGAEEERLLALFGFAAQMVGPKEADAEVQAGHGERQDSRIERYGPFALLPRNPSPKYRPNPWAHKA